MLVKYLHTQLRMFFLACRISFYFVIDATPILYSTFAHWYWSCSCRRWDKLKGLGVAAFGHAKCLVIRVPTFVQFVIFEPIGIFPIGLTAPDPSTFSHCAKRGIMGITTLFQI